MKKVLDLTVFEETTMELRINAETTLFLKKPSQKMVIELLKFRDINENSEAESIVKAIDDLCLLILNTNDAHILFTKQKMDAMLDTQRKLLILNGYSEFITEIQSDPN